MNRISQKDIINAIQQIQFNPELRKGRASSTYDLIFEGIAYPPKLVISIANEAGYPTEWALLLRLFSSGAARFT